MILVIIIYLKVIKYFPKFKKIEKKVNKNKNFKCNDKNKYIC